MTHPVAEDIGRVTFAVRTAPDGAVSVAIEGDLDIASAPAVRERLLSLLRPGACRLVVDMSAVRYADASGLAVLASTQRRAALLGGGLRLAGRKPGPAAMAAPALAEPGADGGELRGAVAALLDGADAWRDADPRRRFSPSLRALALAYAGTSHGALVQAARSLLLVLSREPLTYSPVVAATATRLRRLFPAPRRPAMGS